MLISKKLKMKKIISSLLFLMLLITASISLAHPYHSPLNFKIHQLPDDRVVYSNLPLSCFKNGLMTCGDYHPVLRMHGNYPDESDLQSTKTSISIKE